MSIRCKLWITGFTVYGKNKSARTRQGPTQSEIQLIFGHGLDNDSDRNREFLQRDIWFLVVGRENYNVAAALGIYVVVIMLW